MRATALDVINILSRIYVTKIVSLILIVYDDFTKIDIPKLKTLLVAQDYPLNHNLFVLHTDELEDFQKYETTASPDHIIFVCNDIDSAYYSSMYPNTQFFNLS